MSLSDMYNEDGPWCVSLYECLSCFKKWVGVYPLGLRIFRCPQCNSEDTVPVDHFN